MAENDDHHAGVSDVVDAALIRIAPFGPEYHGGLSNHAPMAVEALHRLGHNDAIAHYVDAVIGHLDRQTESAAPFSGELLESAPPLGNDDYAGWLATFEAELRIDTWTAVANRWVGHLVPGVVAHAGHGAIRTAHAVRSLQEADTAPRRAELARGLAYWAAGAVPFGAPPTFDGTLAWPDLWEELRRRAPTTPPVGMITARLDTLNEDPSFAELVNRAAAPDPKTCWEDLLVLAADSCAHATSATVIGLVHGVTIPDAARALLAHGGDPAGVFARAFQASAALHAVHSGVRHDPIALSWDDTVAAAVDSHDEHAIKITAACAGDGSMAAAASNAVGIISSWR